MDSYRNFFWILGTAIAAIFVSCTLGLLIGMKGAVLGGLLVPCLVLSFRFPYWGLLAFLVYLPFGGTITYGVAGVFQKVGGRVTYDNSSYALFHLAKDAFYFPALLAILLIPRNWRVIRRKLRPLLIAIAILLISCLLTFVSTQLFHSGKSILMGIIGLKVMLGYIPWIFCGIYLLGDRRALIWFFRLWIILIVVCCSLNLIQYALLVTGVCPGNTHLPAPAASNASLQARCFVGGSLLHNSVDRLTRFPGFMVGHGFGKGLWSWNEHHITRLPGTFVSPWQWAWFLISSCFISYGARLLEPSPRWRWLGGFAIATVLGATLVSGQKTSLLAVPLFFIVQLIVTERRKQNLAIKLGLISIFSVIAATQLRFVQLQILALRGRWLHSPIDSFVADQFQWLAKSKLTLFGHGLGTTASAARRLGDIRLIETFYAKIIYEIGIVGFIAFLALLICIVVLTFKSWQSLKDPAIKGLGLCLWLFLLFISVNPYYYPLMVDPVTVYYWLVAGILLKLPAIEAFAPSNDLSLPIPWRKGFYPSLLKKEIEAGVNLDGV